MKCPNCGETSRIREKDKYCHKCGCRLQAEEKTVDLGLIKESVKDSGNDHRFVVDYEFNHIMATDVKVSIAAAFILLEAGLKEAANYGRLSESSISLLEKKTGQMKQEINDFIDSQKQRVIEGAKAREQAGRW